MSHNTELAEHYLELGVEAKRVGQYNKAIQFYKKAESLNPHEEMIYYSLAKTYYIVENYDGAIQNYLKYASIKGLSHNLLMHLGHALIDGRNKPYFRKMYLASLDPLNRATHSSGISEFMWSEQEDYDNFCASNATEFINNLQS